MSTILDALRKAKTEPTRGSMEAREEILRGQTHDYLATVPGKGHDEVRILRRVVYLSAVLIVLLVLVLLALLVKQQGGRIGLARDERASAPIVDQPSPAEAAPGTEGSTTKMDTPVEITVATPTVVPAESPMVPPAETPLPVTEATDGAQSDDELLAKADALRTEKLRAPRRPEPSAEASSAGFSTADIRIGGIVWDKQSPVAMVDGKVVRPGSVVRGARVVRINRDSVVFESDGKQYTVHQ